MLTLQTSVCFVKAPGLSTQSLLMHILSVASTNKLANCRQGKSVNAADVAASLWQCLPSAVSSNPANAIDEAHRAVVRSALEPILSTVQALVQTSSGQPP
jgi:hypothetical protein